MAEEAINPAAEPEKKVEHAEQILPPVVGDKVADSGKGLFNRLAGAVSEFAERRGVIIKGRGRPKNCRACGGVGCGECNGTGKIPGKGDKVAEVGPAVRDVPVQSDGAPAGAAVGAVVGPVGGGKADTLLCRSIVSGYRGVIRGAIDIGRSMARRAGFDHSWTREVFDRAEPKEADFADLKEGLELCREKYGWDANAGPEFLAGGAALRIAAPLGAILWELRNEIARRRQAEKGGNP